MKALKSARNFLQALFPVLLFSLASCEELEPVELVAIESAKMVTMSPEKIEMELVMKLKNPNSMSFTVTGADLDVQLGKMKMGNAHLKGKVKVPARSEKSHTFKLVATPESLLSGGLNSLLSLMGKSSSDISIKGFIKVRAFGIVSRKFPIDEKGKVPMMGK